MSRFLIIILVKFVILIKSSQGTGLCAESRNHDVDCSNMVSLPNNPHACSVKYFPPNSTECSIVHFEETSDSAPNLGKVRFKPFVWYYKNSSLYSYTVFNVSFLNIQWTSALFRFSNINKPLKNHCRKIVLDDDYDQNNLQINSLTLNYDCYWSWQNDNYEHTNFMLEYNLQNSADDVQYGKYYFRVPSVNEIASMHSNCRPFVYFDLEDVDTIFVHIVNLNDTCNVRKYYVNFLTENTNVTTEVNCDKTSNETIAKYSRTEFGNLSINISIEVGDNHYKSTFYVMSINLAPNELNLYTSSLKIIAVVFIVFVICTGVFIQQRYRYYRNKSSNILLFHTPGSSKDYEVFEMLVNCLKNDLNFNVAYEKDIKFTMHQDPALWSIDACNTSNPIVYVVNPLKKRDSQNHDIYVDIDKKILEIIKNNTQLKRRTIMVHFGTYDKNDIPHELKAVKMYDVFKDWSCIYSILKKYNKLDNKLLPVPTIRKLEKGKQLHKLIQRINSAT